MSADHPNQHFTPPRMAKPIDAVLRFGMEMNYGTIYVLFCGGFLTLSAYLCFRENVEVYDVDNVEELRELLTSADGVPADLVVIYNDSFQNLPPMTFRSPVDGHESTIVFSLDADLTKDGELDKWYALVDSLRPKKQQFVEEYRLYSKLHPESKEDADP